MAGLRVPSIVLAHTVLKHPTRHQRSVLEAIVALADQVVVMSDAASQRLCDGFDIDRHKVITIPHGATLPTKLPLKRSGRPTLLTWGLLGPGKGVERVIDAMGSLRDLNGRPRYLIAGRTHPKVLAADGLPGSGAGIIVGHDDHDALAGALRRVLTDPRISGSMAAEARRLAPTMAWSVVARAYLVLAQRLVTGPPALVWP